jgi:hypothetical protein
MMALSKRCTSSRIVSDLQATLPSSRGRLWEQQHSSSQLLFGSFRKPAAPPPAAGFFVSGRGKEKKQIAVDFTGWSTEPAAVVLLTSYRPPRSIRTRASGTLILLKPACLKTECRIVFLRQFRSFWPIASQFGYS